MLVDKRMGRKCGYLQRRGLISVRNVDGQLGPKGCGLKNDYSVKEGRRVVEQNVGEYVKRRQEAKVLIPRVSCNR